ncbi:MAG: hypothetical protein K9G67_04520 [Bacteroidales bacterium]|nr:hypothetical protein [Bacteroidales bacterium]MCF8343546.1 hypothetical protein [Bacteroidales bacterium]MCF8375597.1 hypothetical protein [Bacteroidales bacterium]
MEIYYGTKEENNKRREEEFLRLPGAERVLVALRMIEESAFLSDLKNKAHPNDSKGNFVLINSKIRSKRAKDMLDIHELKRINKIGGE